MSSLFGRQVRTIGNPNLKDTIDLSEEISDDDSDDTSFNNDNIDGMGAGSQTRSNLSQFRSDIESEFDLSAVPNSSQNYNHNNVYHTLKPLFDDVVQKISNEQQLNECRNLLETFSFKLSSDSMKDRVFQDDEMTFLGECHGSKHPDNRHKFAYERFKRKRT